MTADLVRFEGVDVVFGPNPARALAMLDAGQGRDAILKATGHTVAVHGATLGVAEGELCVLMGLSGSGKSSLLRCVNGLNTVARGRVLVRDGDVLVDVARCDAQTLRRLRRGRVSMVFQQFALMPWRTIRDNVGFGLEISGLSRVRREAVVTEMLHLVRLDAWADKHPAELSGGMQQRVGLARAFATNADILLMDEPFSALDPLIRAHLQDELLDLQRRLRKTIIFVSHDLDEALKIGNRIAIMESGRIVQVGPPEEIVTRPADDYVANFVANVNPVNVLRGETLMRAAASLPRVDGALLVDAALDCRCWLDAAGRLAQVTVGGVAVQPWREDGEGVPVPGMVAVAASSVPMRRAVDLSHRTGRPVLLVDPDGRLAGTVGQGEIVAGLVREAAPHRPEGQ